MSLRNQKNLEVFIDVNEDELLEIWDQHKYEQYCGEYFHHDDVDWFNECFFLDMCQDIYDYMNKKAM